MTEQLSKIVEAIRSAESKGLLVESDGLSGFSGTKLIGALQRLARLQTDAQRCYVEVGVFQGLTLLSVANAIREQGTAFGIDNFAFFDPENENKGLVERRRDHLQLENAHLIDLDYEDALHGIQEHIGDQKMGLYFVDGPHDYRSQLVCLLFALPHLTDDAVIIVDDCNYRHVRQANADFLRSHPEFRLVYQSYEPAHPQNLSEADRNLARRSWWNGVNIMVRDTSGSLPAFYPPTHRSRALYENEHSIHSERFPEAALLGTRLAEEYRKGNLRKVITVNRKLRRMAANPEAKFAKMNTHSHDLPKHQFHPDLKPR